ncbi:MULTISPECIES: hypothetical protein [unclassified Novosphingobium]|uniref:hypothetical protein n=1 Tax=unclassified Novosphingobium TaxID=2644732 RepID=UPI00135A3A3A|nr:MULTISPECIES: hypothetical protein [unclassified Novosphingobium]
MMLAMSAMLAAAPATAMAQTPRELLTIAAFQAPTKPRALALIGQAITASDRILASRPGDREATLQRGVAIGYRAKLTRSRSDARTSLGIFERLAAENPRDPEAQMVIAGWHLDAIDQLGAFIARTALGAKAQVGEAALARAVALGGDRAFYPGLAAMMQIRRNDTDVVQARRWAEAAATGQTPTPLDTLMKRAALAILPALRTNDGGAAAALSRKLLPFGKMTD